MNINLLLPAGNAGCDADGDNGLFSRTFNTIPIFVPTVAAKFFIW